MIWRKQMMKKRIQLIFPLALVLVLLSACRGNNTPATTAPTTTAPTTQATTAPTTHPATTPTTENGNGPLITEPGDQPAENGTQTTTAPTGETANGATTNR